MGIIELLLIAVGLSMDAFAVAVCQGLAMPRTSFKNALTVGLYFGVFQAAMPLIGYFLGSQFAGLIESYDHWVAFVLLGFIGVRMIIGSLKKDDKQDADGSSSEGGLLAPAKMLPLAVATSIDALAVGLSFAFLSIDIGPAVAFIGVTTLVLSFVGVRVGGVFGSKFKSKAELAGGVILVLIGLKILLEHTGIISF